MFARIDKVLYLLIWDKSKLNYLAYFLAPYFYYYFSYVPYFSYPLLFGLLFRQLTGRPLMFNLLMLRVPVLVPLCCNVSEWLLCVAPKQGGPSQQVPLYDIRRSSPLWC